MSSGLGIGRIDFRLDGLVHHNALDRVKGLF